MINNQRIFLTGGTGFLGKAIINKYYNQNEITVFSRDEAKQYYLKKQFPNVNFIVGDIRNYDLLKRSSKNHSIGIFTASFKQIEACYDNYEEANEVIVKGAFNSRLIAEENNFTSACFVSSDKSRAATTIYGAMKYVAGESFIANSHKSNVNLTTIIYGNVANSTGSIIPLIWKSLSEKFQINLYGKEMTRFIIDVNDAVNYIEKSLKYKGVNIIPKIKSIKINELFELYKENFGLHYQISSPRDGEKIHEIMASNEEIRRMRYIDHDDIYVMDPKTEYNSVTFDDNEYSSKNSTMNKQELHDFLIERNFYKL
jgi:UDP-glucose 4-epimerase